jgi:hypothetical protein
LSDSWLRKNTRPLTLIFLTVMMTLFVILDSTENKFVVKNEFIDLLKYLLVTVYAAYFGSRGWEKINKTKWQK